MTLETTFIAAVAALLLAATPSQAAPSTTDQTFTFAGTCTDCTGDALGTLVLGTTPGQTVFTTADFVSFTYSSNLIPAVDITAPTSFSANFITLPGASDVSLNSATFKFETFTGGNWCIGFACGLHYGAGHVWSVPTDVVTAPEPTSIALLAVGLATLAARRRRR